MAKLPLIQPATDRPTYFNRDMAVGASLGLFLLPVSAITVPVGAVIGGLIGKANMERDVRHGKIAHEPTIFNKDTVIGTALGLLAGGVMGVAGILAGGMIGADVALASGVLGLATGVIGGAAMGARSGYDRLEHEYQQAETFARALAHQHAAGRSQEPQRSYTVSPEEAMELEARLKGGGTKERSFVAELAARNNPAPRPKPPANP